MAKLLPPARCNGCPSGKETRLTRQMISPIRPGRRRIAPSAASAAARPRQVSRQGRPGGPLLSHIQGAHPASRAAAPSGALRADAHGLKYCHLRAATGAPAEKANPSRPDGRRSPSAPTLPPGPRSTPAPRRLRQHCPVLRCCPLMPHPAAARQPHAAGVPSPGAGCGRGRGARWREF